MKHRLNQVVEEKCITSIFRKGKKQQVFNLLSLQINVFRLFLNKIINYSFGLSGKKKE